MACTTEKRSISNRNKTEWRRIRGVIGRVIREADLKLRARLLPELYSTQPYYQQDATERTLRRRGCGTD